MSKSKSWLPHVVFLLFRRIKLFWDSTKSETFENGLKLACCWPDNMEFEKVQKNAEKGIKII